MALTDCPPSFKIVKLGDIDAERNSINAGFQAILRCMTARTPPDPAGHAGEWLTTDGTNIFWATLPTGGSVTSVGVAGNNGIGVSGSPITSSGTITLSLGAITPASVSTGSLTASGSILLPANSIIRANLANGAACSVIGRSANSSGAVADITASTNDRLLSRTSNTLAFTQLTAGMVPSALVTNAMLRNSSALSLIGRSANSVGAPADIVANSSGDVPFVENSVVVFDNWIRQRRNIMRGFWEFETGGAQDANGTIYGTPFKASVTASAAVGSASRSLNTNANSCVLTTLAASAYAGFYSDHGANQVGIPFNLGVTTVEYMVTLQGGLSTVGEEYRDMFGCIDVVTGTPVYGVWFEYDRATAGNFWRICARNGGATTKTTTATAVANGTPYRLRFEVTTSSNVNFYVNGAFVGSVTTNIPPFGSLGAAMYRISGTNNLFVDIDYVAYQCVLTTPRSATQR